MTGATGSLGSYILDELLADPTVETVYCLCRARDDADAADRLAMSMRTRKLSKRFSDANMKMIERVVALAADLPAVRLGLDEERYHEIVNRVTVIIHVRGRTSVFLFASYRAERVGGQLQSGNLQVCVCADTPCLSCAAAHPIS